MLTNEQIKDVNDFKNEMLKKLDLYSHKGDWDKLETTYLYKRLIDEVKELREILNKIINDGAIEDLEALSNECADIGNFAMMIQSKRRVIQRQVITGTLKDI